MNECMYGQRKVCVDEFFSLSGIGQDAMSSTRELMSSSTLGVAKP